eukprot:gene894-biopygen1868
MQLHLHACIAGQAFSVKYTPVAKGRAAGDVLVLDVGSLWPKRPTQPVITVTTTTECKRRCDALPGDLSFLSSRQQVPAASTQQQAAHGSRHHAAAGSTQLAGSTAAAAAAAAATAAATAAAGSLINISSNQKQHRQLAAAAAAVVAAPAALLAAAGSVRGPNNSEEYSPPAQLSSAQLSSAQRPQYSSPEDEGRSQTWFDNNQLLERIAEFESAALGEKPWHLVGEVAATGRPMNSALEIDMEYDTTNKPPPAPTEAATQSLEDIIKRRIAEQ